jgi:hypothetical protein
LGFFVGFKSRDFFILIEFERYGVPRKRICTKKPHCGFEPQCGSLLRSLFGPAMTAALRVTPTPLPAGTLPAGSLRVADTTTTFSVF